MEINQINACESVWEHGNVHNVALRGHVMHMSYLMADTQRCQQMGVGAR